MSTLILERFEVLTAFFTTAACHCISDHFRHERLEVPPRVLGARTEYFTLCDSVSVQGEWALRCCAHVSMLN